ncbi:mannosyltransferase [Tulasnella sp. JGI-2019a]|nr:mannosyltransferase [Tulasnella sp. JGI-2019a]
MGVKQLDSADVLWTILPMILITLFVRRLVTLRVRKPPNARGVAILVLGDIGRSPRTMYHAESFARAGWNTFIVGYKGTKVPPSLLTAPRIRFYYLTQPLKLPRKLFVLLAPYKVIHQLVTLVYGLTRGLYQHRPPQYILVQNPPSIPTLAVVQFLAWLRGCRVIIDWHNTGYSILALKLGPNHPLVKIAEIFERTFGRNAYAHLFVTDAMRVYLDKKWNLRGHKVVFHDRPPARFHASSATEAHELLLRIPLFNPPILDFLPKVDPPVSTFRTEVSSVSPGRSDFSIVSDVFSSPLPAFRADRPALVVSSTSWTPDEDFGMLLEALQGYEKRARTQNAAGQVESKRLPKLMMVVTGKGPLQEPYMKKLLKLERSGKWEWVRCRTMWLEAADYPLLLGAADIGISLHSSSSALDLPMKVVDMFGLNELVIDGKNGLVFKDAQQLGSQLEMLLEGFPVTKELDRLRSSLTVNTERMYHQARGAVEPWCTWETNWDAKIRPLVDPDVARDVMTG